jgi:hypothetical protein
LIDTHIKTYNFYYSTARPTVIIMAFQYDPNQQGQFPQDNGNGMQQQQQQQGPPPPQGMQGQQQPMQGQEGGSPAPFAQQGGGEGSVGGDQKTTLWYVIHFLVHHSYSTMALLQVRDHYHII